MLKRIQHVFFSRRWRRKVQLVSDDRNCSCFLTQQKESFYLSSNGHQELERYKNTLKFRY